MDVETLYSEFRNHFPDLAKSADAKHLAFWESVDPLTMHAWFESLAKTLNDHMGQSDRQAERRAVFTFFERAYHQGDAATKNCIDVSLVENLFWQVPARHVAPIWDSFPKTLQSLYVDFHKRPPAH